MYKNNTAVCKTCISCRRTPTDDDGLEEGLCLAEAAAKAKLFVGTTELEDWLQPLMHEDVPKKIASQKCRENYMLRRKKRRSKRRGV